ncbi:MAG: hypothetical protein PHW18_10310 [Sulfuricurvum sp.]|uniref:hypothetical protein n=1 Tax=Sulfuricurvum sp. TaxID=2025608 RepID=UPI002614D902|nr:hypothetical protein [Sulfuricurvum sp.]MDD2829955.1 hypothetical protein [Sulfuricurvum sp.]
MKVAIQCDSPLLQRSLELFLEGHLSSRRHCDIIVRDKAIIDDEYPTLFISSDATADLVKPFSKAQLFEALHLSLQRAQGLNSPLIKEEAVEESVENRVGFEILEHHIEKLTREYQANILKAVRAFYEK